MPSVITTAFFMEIYFPDGRFPICRLYVHVDAGRGSGAQFPVPCANACFRQLLASTTFRSACFSFPKGTHPA